MSYYGVLIARNIVVIITLIIVMLYYYKLASSKRKDNRRMAALMKIVSLMISLILAFAQTDYLRIGDLTFGGRMSVMMLTGFEIIDTIIGLKEE